jgi:hypothetical protein
MKLLPSSFDRAVGWFSFLKRRQPIANYTLRVVSLPAELNRPNELPPEFRFILAKEPAWKEELRAILSNGKAIGIRTVERSPEEILSAVNHIAIYSQERMILSWLPGLLSNQREPQFTAQEIEAAKSKSIDLYDEVKTILTHRLEFKKFVLVDEDNRGVSDAERALIRRMNEDLFPVSIRYIVNRVIYDNAHTRTEVAQSIIKALLFVGPITHILEHYVRGIGKVFAASADDLLSETAELFALHGSGFAWKVLWKRSRILIPVFILATWGAFRVEHYVELDQYALAGAIFGLSAVALSLTTAIQSVFLYRQCVDRLISEKKLPKNTRRWNLAIRQDFTNPARLGLFIGAIASPVIGLVVFNLFHHLVHNGWVLALLGSTESLVAASTVLAAQKINEFRFNRKLDHWIQNPKNARVS